MKTALKFIAVWIVYVTVIGVVWSGFEWIVRESNYNLHIKTVQNDCNCEYHKEM